MATTLRPTPMSRSIDRANVSRMLAMKKAPWDSGGLVHVWKHKNVHADMPADVCSDMCADMCADMCGDMYTDMLADLCVDMCMDMRIDMCIDMNTATFKSYVAPCAWPSVWADI